MAGQARGKRLALPFPEHYSQVGSNVLWMDWVVDVSSLLPSPLRRARGYSAELASHWASHTSCEFVTSVMSIQYPVKRGLLRGAVQINHGPIPGWVYGLGLIAFSCIPHPWCYGYTWGQGFIVHSSRPDPIPPDTSVITTLSPTVIFTDCLTRTLQFRPKMIRPPLHSSVRYRYVNLAWVSMLEYRRWSDWRAVNPGLLVRENDGLLSVRWPAPSAAVMASPCPEINPSSCMKHIPISLTATHLKTTAI